jgi:hypothetical protein
MVPCSLGVLRASETLVDSETTWCYIPETSHTHTRCCENLKSNILNLLSHLDSPQVIFMKTMSPESLIPGMAHHFQFCTFLNFKRGRLRIITLDLVTEQQYELNVQIHTQATAPKLY